MKSQRKMRTDKPRSAVIEELKAKGINIHRINEILRMFYYQPIPLTKNQLKALRRKRRGK